MDPRTGCPTYEMMGSLGQQKSWELLGLSVRHRYNCSIHLNLNKILTGSKRSFFRIFFRDVRTSTMFHEIEWVDPWKEQFIHRWWSYPWKWYIIQGAARTMIGIQHSHSKPNRSIISERCWTSCSAFFGLASPANKTCRYLLVIPSCSLLFSKDIEYSRVEISLHTTLAELLCNR